MHKLKTYNLDVKSVDDNGALAGYASVFGVIDRDNEIVDKGAFRQSLEKAGGKIVLCWQHDKARPIGFAEVSEDEYGLKFAGQLMSTEDAQVAREYCKAAIDAGLKAGVSVGFLYSKDKTYVKDGVRHFQEAELVEISIVTVASNTAAEVATVKSRAATKAAFNDAMAAADVRMKRWVLCEVLCDSLCGIVDDMEMVPEAKVAAAGESIDEFKTAYLEWLPAYAATVPTVTYGDMPAMDMAADDITTKAGRKISAASRKRIETAISELNALLIEVQAAVDEADAEDKSKDVEFGEEILAQFRKLLK